MKRTETISLDGRTYSTTHYVTTTGLRLFLKLIKLLGESLFKLFFFGDKSGLDMEVDQVVGPFLSKMEPEECISLVKEILATTMIKDGDKIRDLNFDMDFDGRYLHLFKLVGLVIRFQYADFLAGTASPEEGEAVSRVKALR